MEKKKVMKEEKNITLRENEKNEVEKEEVCECGEVCEAMPDYSPTGRIVRLNPSIIGDKTIDDYLAMPEGARVELIDGRFYDMAAPTTIHQSIVFEIASLFKDFISKKGGSCTTFIAPTDVQLDRDNKTMVQPDVFVVCDRSKITPLRVVGAPDLVLEIMSPSNVFKDTLIKLLKYKYAGVREYWIIAPDEKSILVYDFEHDRDWEMYTFDDTVPVNIWNGECRVDFREIYSRIEFLYEAE